MGGLSSPSGLTQTSGLAVSSSSGPPGPPGGEGILLENTTDFLMLEDGLSFLLQE
jgi:hypothetical protein